MTKAMENAILAIAEGRPAPATLIPALLGVGCIERNGRGVRLTKKGRDKVVELVTGDEGGGEPPSAPKAEPRPWPKLKAAQAPQAAPANNGARVWLDKLPPKAPSRGQQGQEPVFLRERPGQWSEIRRSSVKGTANNWKARGRKHYTPLGYEFAVRTDGAEFVLYGRWVGAGK